MSLHKIPNFLTLLRIFLIPVLIISFFAEGETTRYIAASIFIFASITDYFDGMLARRFKSESNFGRMLDPVADKMLVVATLLMLVYTHMAPVIPILAILCREIMVSGLREYLAQIKVSMPVTKLTKIKTAVQMTAIIVILLGEECTHIRYIDEIGVSLLWIAAFLTVFTGYIYAKESFKHLE